MFTGDPSRCEHPVPLTPNAELRAYGAIDSDRPASKGHIVPSTFVGSSAIIFPMDGHVGVDESGKGDFFGPLVIAACYVGPEHLAELEGVKDSKKLTDPIALRLSVVIARTCPHSVVAIGPAKYNELYEKFRNLNKLLAWGHARAIENVLEQQPCNLVISDQFADPAGLKRQLFEHGRQVTLQSMVRAEADIAVAAASVLARAEFLRRLKRLGEEFGIELPKGASPQVIAAGKRFVAQKGLGELPKVAKMHFKTVQSVVL